MENNNKLSLSDSDMLREDEKLLNLLLKDHTTGKNIKWGTDSYINHGYSFRYDQEIKIDLITGWYEDFIRPRVDKDIDVQLERQRNKAEVFTPSWVIKLQVEAALEDMKELPLADFIQTKWLEITCGEAPYMVNRYDMETGEVIPLKDRAGFIDDKFKKINEAIDSEEEWLKLAVEIYKASYGYEYQGDSLLLARENLILTFIDNYFYMFGAFPKEKVLLKITKIISLNVFQMDGLTYEVPYSDGGSKEFDTQLSLFEEVESVKTETPKLTKIKLWKSNRIVEFKNVLERIDAPMKFDVVIGNPPYQIEGTGDNSRDEPIYHVFMDQAYSIGDKVSLITPGRFLFNVGQTPSKWNEKMLNDPHFKVSYYERDSSQIFSNTDIMGGVAISYRDTEKVFGAIKTFTPFKELDTILQKVETRGDFDPLSNIIHSSMSYKFSKKLYEELPEVREKSSKNSGNSIRTNAFDRLSFLFYDEKPEDGEEYIKILGRQKNKRTHKWIKKRYIENHPNLNSYKVILPKSNGSGAIGEVNKTPLIGEPLIGKPLVGHTQTYISIGEFHNQFEANSALKYVKSKFSRTMLGILKTTQDNQKKVWTKVPTQDFTAGSDIDWSKSIEEVDLQLYEKYGLSKKEINFIETHVKEME